VLKKYLYTHIPITQDLGIGVVSIESGKLVLSADFQKNINHKKTVFGGSLQSVATLSAWSLIYTYQQESRPEIVIMDSKMKFLKPTTGDFQAVAYTPSNEAWDRFEKVYSQKGSGKIVVDSKITCNGVVTATFQGIFAVYDMRS